MKKYKFYFDSVIHMIAYVVISISLFLMLRLVFSYASFQTNIGFLRLKQDYISIPVWRFAFYTHVFSSVFCLLAGFTQFSRTLLRQHKGIHRFVGKLYIFNILIINFPVGLIMAYYANGLLPSKIAFTILDFLWFRFTYKAYIEARKGNILSHKRFMIRSFALTFSAITLRTWNGVLSTYTELEPTTIYMINAWIGFVPNMIIAELILARFSFFNLLKTPS